MKKLAVLLHRLKKLADESAGEFQSEGFAAFFAMVRNELNDEYFSSFQSRLQELEFRNGVPISAELGEGNKSERLILNKPSTGKKSIWKRLFGNRSKGDSAFTLMISSGDIYGRQAMSELEDKVLNLASNATAQSTDHIFSFFRMLRTELGFYLSCLNLYEKLTEFGEPTAFPVPSASTERKHSFKGLYDVCLCLTMNRKIVGNEVNADAKDLVIVTGANQGGKSAFLRSIGLSQLMMQCGMFVPAESYSANLCTGLFTHYAREEDSDMKSGKLEEELSWMSDIVEQLRQNSIVLFNETFAATNEREGSELARQIVDALLDRKVKVLFVTHFYELSNGFYNRQLKNSIFLRAQTQPDGGRTYKELEDKPLLTSYGNDLYDQIFESER
jgi:DNA mismatch repair ATPase MutS